MRCSTFANVGMAVNGIRIYPDAFDGNADCLTHRRRFSHRFADDAQHLLTRVCKNMAASGVNFATKNEIMNYKTIEDKNRQQFAYQWELLCNASTIGELFPNCKEVCIDIEIKHTSAFGVNQRRFSKTLLPADKLYLYFDCINNDCTGNGFILTNLVRESLQTKSEKSGELHCNGKEDWKYIDSSGNSCLSCLRYSITPIFEENT